MRVRRRFRQSDEDACSNLWKEVYEILAGAMQLRGEVDEIYRVYSYKVEEMRGGVRVEIRTFKGELNCICYAVIHEALELLQ